MSAVEFDQVTKRFGDVVAVDALTLEARDQEFLVLLGPSGCGKSTALRMIAGLDDPTEGEIRIGGRPMNDVDPKHRDVAMVFQSYALYPHMTVRKNIEFPLNARKVASVERAALVDDAAKRLGLSDLLDRKPAHLSGGQRQRVALARAIVRRPEVFLMDEPLSNLDAKLRVQTRIELVEMQRTLETTLVYVTHDQIEAMTMGHRIAIMRDGVLQQVGAPQHVYERPANRFVAEFIGTPPMNVFSGAIVDDAVRVGDDNLGSCVGAARGSVSVGVRPEAFLIGGHEHSRPLTSDGSVNGGALRAVVVTVESLGHERHLHCRLTTSDVVIVRQAAHDVCPAPGESLSLTVRGEDVHLFDIDSGQRCNAE